MAAQTAIIPINTKPSQAMETAGAEAGSFQVPATITGATIAVEISNDGTNFTEVVEEGAEANPITVAANGIYVLPIKTFSAKYFRLTSASNEAAARSLSVYLRKP
jgi:hypothetical protein